MLLTWIIGVFAACGAVWLFGLLLDALSMPIPQSDSLHIFFLRGDAARAEQTCKACLRLLEHRRMCGAAVFVDDGLQPEARKAVTLLLRRQDAAQLCDRVQLAEYVLGEHEGWKMN